MRVQNRVKNTKTIGKSHTLAVGCSDKDSVKPSKRIEMTDTKELIALVSEFLESVHAGEWTGDVSRDEALVALESLTQQLAELQAKLEDALKDRVALAMALDCGHRPPCEECRLYPPTAQQAQPEPEPSVPEGWKQAVALAYGHLWHVNNEPMAPIPLRSSETAAYEARKQLRDLLTREERGLAINQVQALLAAAPQPKETK